MRSGTNIGLLSLLSTLCLSTQVPPPPTNFTSVQTFNNITLRYREVPSGICELQSGVRSVSGYVDISENEHIFFWFFEARNSDPTTAPLTAWISGGPGDSSMSELFTEHGPCRIHPDGETVHYNPFSWNNFSNTLYIDQPVQVGFSYSELVPAYFEYGDGGEEDIGSITPLDPDEDCPDDADQCGFFSDPNTSSTTNSTIAAAPNFWLTLQSFMTAFPQYSSNGFHFGSESYGGHYVPIFSKYIIDQNDANILGAQHINLSSIIVGNGWYVPRLHMEAWYDFAVVANNTYDYDPLNETTKQDIHDALYGSGGCLEQNAACNSEGQNDVCQSADHFCLTNVQDAFLDVTNRNLDDVRELGESPFPNEFYSSYLQLPKVREAIGAYQTYIELNPTVGDAFDSTGDDARELGIIGILAELVERGVRVTLYAGDADYDCNWLGSQAVAEEVAAPGYDRAGWTDLETIDEVGHGQVRQSGLFSLVRIFEAGHATGAFQPLALQAIFSRTIAGMDLATGEVAADGTYKSEGPLSSVYREGNRTVQLVEWDQSATYNATSNEPTYADCQPFWDEQTRKVQICT